MAAPRLKLLFATRTSPFAGDFGSGAYVFDVLSYLKKSGFDIIVVWTEPPDLNPTGGWYRPPAESLEVFTLHIMNMHRVGPSFWRPSIVWLPLKARLSHRVKTVLRKVGLWRDRSRPTPSAVTSSAAASHSSTAPVWGADASPAEIAFVRGAIARHRPDVVMAGFSWMAPAIRASTPAAPLQPLFAVLTQDVRHRQVHLRNGVLTEVLNEHTPLEQELSQLASADALIAIQSTEAAVFARHFPGKTIVTAPMCAALRPIPVPAAPVALFVGSGHGPNLAGLRWFLAHVWPTVLRELPAARLLIAGSICSSLTESLPSQVEKLGRLPDLATAYAQASVAIAPILQGSGIKIKILEALAYGRACITTSVGIEGLEKLRPEIRVADTPESFARELLALLRDPALAASSAAHLQSLALKHLSPDACYRPVADLLRTLAAGKIPVSTST